MSRLLIAMLMSFASLSASAVPDTVFKEWIRSNEAGETQATPPPPAPGSVAAIQGGSFYIVDTSKPVEFTFVTTHAGHDLVLSVASLDSTGNAGPWQEVFQKIGNSVRSNDYRIDPTFYSYSPTGLEIVFKLNDLTSGYTYYSGLASGNPDNYAHTVSYYDYYDGKTLVGFEDLFNGGDKDFDDLVFLVSNVSGTPIPSVPEPETYAMLLAGLGLIGTVVRGRKRMM